MIQQMSSPSVEADDAQRVLGIASELYQKSYRAYQDAQYLRSAEYAVAVKDLMRAIDKFYNVAITRAPL